MTHYEYQKSTGLIPKLWGQDHGGPIWIFLVTSNTGKPEFTNEDRLIPAAVYVLPRNENTSGCDRHTRKKTYLTTTSYEEVKGNV